MGKEIYTILENSSDQDRNAFSNYFKSPAEFESVIASMCRDEKLNLDFARKNKLRFVGKLIGKDKADTLSPGELDVFIRETEKVITNNQNLISGAKAHLAAEASRAGFVEEGGYDTDGEKFLVGDTKAFEDHINYGETPDKD